MQQTKVTVWNEYLHEVLSEEIAAIYPKGIHNCIAEFLEEAGMSTKTATLRMPEHGLTEEVLADTDVLIWWGHIAHDKVDDEIVQRVHDHVTKRGMGLIVLHSGHASKIFKKICGTDSECLKWRENGEKEILWGVNPSHPIMNGLPEKIILEQEETYGEHFLIPQPDELIFISWFSGGEVFRSGCCFNRGKGRIFYFKPGHEAYPIYYNPQIQQVIVNAVNWAKPVASPEIVYGHYTTPTKDM
ncbi:ThuA domain-containing protein [Scatolibacter rhodanostii]|uniref:ThuA domain-containing protein n=1 Tax=Scatolibacter rhodanostii TaxID=2014781 RepID=UPI000C07A878|nr:ThuA domain-containing protein [Scatolibacter rhodanostii]